MKRKPKCVCINDSSIVTGVAAGIGQGTCVLFAEEGASVFLSDLTLRRQEPVRLIEA